MSRELIERLIAFPQRGQIQIDFDLKMKFFRLSVPIFASKTPLPPSVKNYVEARQNRVFKPHATSFQAEGSKVFLIQQFPFAADFQSTLRQQVDAFWQMSKQCHQMLSEMAIEEKYKDALYTEMT